VSPTPCPPPTTPGDGGIDGLLVGLAAGDNSCYRPLHDAVTDSVYRVAHRIVRDPHQAEEVRQEVLTEIWQRSARFDPAKGTALTWIMTMARARAIDRVRHSQRSKERDHLYSTGFFTRSVDFVSDSVNSDAQIGMIKQGLSALTPIQREALLLNHLHGLTQSEVAQLLQIPIGTVKTRVRDGLIRLRAQLLRHAQDLDE